MSIHVAKLSLAFESFAGGAANVAAPVNYSGVPVLNRNSVTINTAVNVAGTVATAAAALAESPVLDPLSVVSILSQVAMGLRPNGGGAGVMALHTDPSPGHVKS